MKRGRGRPPKTPTYSSKLLNSSRRGSHHGGPSSARVSSPQGVKTRDSNRSTQRKNYFEGIQFSESDSDSDSSYESSVSSVVSSVRSYKSRRVIPMRTVTPLKLPPSSDDLILPPEQVLQALSIYEVLRQFGRILRLSPFRFEDFCAAIESAEQSVLLSQIHMALFRALLLEDETNGYTFAASDEKDSLNIFLHEVDCFTWPEHIRSYFYSDRSEFSDLFDLMCGRDPENPFPFVSIASRLKVLKRLCDLFLASNTVREVIINEGITESEDHCRSCAKMGDLLCCETCPAVYHLHCLKPPLEMVPDGDWLCPICDEHQLKGVTDCQSDWTKDGWLRHTPLGLDREGRKYWFLSRRLFVESEHETVLYYSSKTHLDELIAYLEVDGQERRLLSAIKTKYNTIIKHMAITESLIEATRGDMTSSLLARRKEKEVEKLDDSKALEEKVLISDNEAKPPKTEVSLTFVPDTAVAKMVTKGKEEPSPNQLEKDRRTTMIEQQKNNKQDIKEEVDIATNKEDHRTVTSDITMQDQSKDTNKIDTSPILSQVFKPDKDKDLTTGTITPTTTSTDKETMSVIAMDVDLNATPLKKESPPSTVSTSSADSVLSSVRKVIDFASSVNVVSSVSKETLGETKDPNSDVEKVDLQVKSESEKEKDCVELNTEVKSEKPVDMETEQMKPEEEPAKPETISVKQEAELDKQESTSIKPEPKGPFFRLGMEGNFTAYVNQYATNPLALNKLQHMEYKERKRAVNNKFSVEHEFKISGEIFGPKNVILNTLRCSVVNLENNIPAAFMHPIWPVQRSTWVRAVHMATTPVEFAAALLFLESLIKPICFLHVWHDALGHNELHRAIVETKAEAKKKKEHKEEEEEVDYQDRVLINYSWVPMHQIWKQKGEEYRIFGGGGWTWESGMAAKKRKLSISKDRRNFESKKRRLCKVVDDFVSKREAKKKEAERKAKAKLAVQAYKDKMKATSTVTPGTTSSTSGTTTVANVGIQMSTSSQKPMVTSVSASSQAKQAVITTSATKTVQQSTVINIKQTALNPALNTVTQPAVTSKELSVKQSTVKGVTQSSVTAVTQSILNPVNISQLATVPKVSKDTRPTVAGATQSTINPLFNTVAGAPKVSNVTQSTIPGVTQTIVNPMANLTQLAAVPKVATITQSTVTGVKQSTLPGVTHMIVKPVANVTQLAAVPKVANFTQSTVTVLTPPKLSQPANPEIKSAKLGELHQQLNTTPSATKPVLNLDQSSVPQMKAVATQHAVVSNMTNLLSQVTTMSQTLLVPNVAAVTQPSLVPVTNVNKPNVTSTAVHSTVVPQSTNAAPKLTLTQSTMSPEISNVTQSEERPNLESLVQPTKTPIAAQPMLQTSLIQTNKPLVNVTQSLMETAVTSLAQSPPVSAPIISEIQADLPKPKVNLVTLAQSTSPQPIVPSIESVKDITAIALLATSKPANSCDRNETPNVTTAQNSNSSTITEPFVSEPSSSTITNIANVSSSKSITETCHVHSLSATLVATGNTSTTSVTHSIPESAFHLLEKSSTDLIKVSISSETNIEKGINHSEGLENISALGSVREEESNKESKFLHKAIEPTNEDKTKTSSNDVVREQMSNTTKTVSITSNHHEPVGLDGMIGSNRTSEQKASIHNPLVDSAAVEKSDTDIETSKELSIGQKFGDDSSTQMTSPIRTDSPDVMKSEYNMTEPLKKQGGMYCAVPDTKFSCEDIEDGWVLIREKLPSNKESESCLPQSKTEACESTESVNELMDYESEDTGKQSSTFSSVEVNTVNDVTMEHDAVKYTENLPDQNCDIPTDEKITQLESKLSSNKATHQATGDIDKQEFNDDHCKSLANQKSCKDISVADQNMSVDCNAKLESATSRAASFDDRSVISQSSSSSLTTTSSVLSNSINVVAGLSTLPNSSTASSLGAPTACLVSSKTVAPVAIESSYVSSTLSQPSSSVTTALSRTLCNESKSADNELPSSKDVSMSDQSLSSAVKSTATYSQGTLVVNQASLPSVTSTSFTKSDHDTPVVSQSLIIPSTITSTQNTNLHAAHTVPSETSTSVANLSLSSSVEASCNTTSSQSTSVHQSSLMPSVVSSQSKSTANTTNIEACQKVSLVNQMSSPSVTHNSSKNPSQSISIMPLSTEPLYTSVVTSTVTSIQNTLSSAVLPTVQSVQSSSVVSQVASPSTASTSIVTSNQNIPVTSQSSLSVNATSIATPSQGISLATLSSTSTSGTLSNQQTSSSVTAPLVITSSPVVSSSVNMKAAQLLANAVTSQLKSTSIIAPATNPNTTQTVVQSVTAVNTAGNESIGVALAKTLINTAVKVSSQNVKQITASAATKAQQKTVKTVSTVSVTRSPVVVSKPTQQLRAIAPQPRPTILPASLQPGQKAVLQTATPQTTQIAFPLIQGNVLQGANVVKINTPAGSSTGTPVNNIAALVASLPGASGNPGQTQLIRFVTPSGATFTVQGTIQAGSQGGAPGATTITVPKSMITGQASPSTKPVVVAPKTVAASATRTTVTLSRPQQPSVTTKDTKVVPEQKEKYPVLEPLIKDPRKLLDRTISKWRKKRFSLKNVFQLKKHETRVLGRRAGMREVHDFMYISRGSGINWPYSFPRPSFKVAWRYRTRSLRTLAGAGLQARILHACLKWEDINVRPPRSNSSTVCTSTGTTTTEIINHRYVTQDGLKCEYLVRKIVRTMQKAVPQIPRPPPPTVSKRGRTLRPKINLQPDDEDDEDEPAHSGPRVFENWCPEAKLELWEIRQYNERKERERAIEREKKLQEETIRRAAELRAAAIQRKQQEQQAKQQQQMLRKKVQNAIKTQQKKFTNVDATTRAVVSTVHKPTISMATKTSINQPTSLIQATVAKQTVPRITNLVTQYRPASLAQGRVPIGTPAPAGMIRTVTRAQVNYRPLATTTQAKTTPEVTPVAKHISGFQIAARNLGTNAPKMKHSSKELQQAKQQIAKSKGKKAIGAGTVQAANKKHISLEARLDMNRVSVCRKLLDQLISKVERSEVLERNKETKRKAVAEKQQRVKATKLDGLLYKRKEILKKEIIRKRAVLEKELSLEIQKEFKKEKETPSGRKRKREGSIETVTEAPADKRQQMDDLYCICKKPYDPTMFYIGCDLCANWFHGECVGVTPEQAETLDQFTCIECRKAQKGVETEELYCLCRQPYDESKFYIGCDACHDWFHGSCVGITEYDADQLDSYICPRCKESQSNRNVQPLTTKDYDSLKRLLRSLQSHKMAWPFLEPVNADEVPGYYQMIKDPMDLSKVEGRISSKHYQTLEQFNADITIMFDNCRFFNPKESPYYRCAEVLEGFFVKKLRSWEKKT